MNKEYESGDEYSDDESENDGGGDEKVDFPFLDLSREIPLNRIDKELGKQDEKDTFLLDFDSYEVDKYKNIYNNRLPLMHIKNYEDVDPVIIFYVVCLYEGIFKQLRIQKKYEQDIPDSIKKYFHIESYSEGFIYMSKHSRSYTKLILVIDDDCINWSTIEGTIEDHKKFSDKDFQTSDFLVVKYKNEKEYKYRRVLMGFTKDRLNTIKSIIQKYGIFSMIISLASNYLPGCLVSDTRFIELGYDILCNKMGINTILGNELTIQNIFDYETRNRSNHRNIMHFLNEGYRVYIPIVLKGITNPKIISVAFPFYEGYTKQYSFNIPADITVIYYEKNKKTAMHSCYIIYDKVSKSAMMYDPHGDDASSIKSAELKTLFGTDDIEIMNNKVIGFQAYDNEGFCFYFSLMFIMIFILVYNWTRVDPVILLNCIESTFYSNVIGIDRNIEQNTMTFIKYFAGQFLVRIKENIEMVYTPSNYDYEVFDNKSNNITYNLSWLIVLLNNIIDCIDVQDKINTDYKDNIEFLEEQLGSNVNNIHISSVQSVTVWNILDSICNDDIKNISSIITDIFGDTNVFDDSKFSSEDGFGKSSHLSIYYYCLMLQLHKIHYMLSIRLTEIHNDDDIIEDSQRKFTAWLKRTTIKRYSRVIVKDYIKIGY